MATKNVELLSTEGVDVLHPITNSDLVNVQNANQNLTTKLNAIDVATTNAQNTANTANTTANNVQSEVTNARHDGTTNHSNLKARLDNMDTKFGRYLPLTGGTVGGNLDVNGNLTNGGNQVWHARNLPVESGEFTPRVDGTISGTMTLIDAKGNYTRIGNIVNVNMEFTIWGRGTAQGNTIIHGLPFTSSSNTAGKSLSVGWVSGLPTGVYILSYVHGGSQGIRLCRKNVTTGTMGYITIDDAMANMPPGQGSTISISGTYTINQ